MYIILSTFYLQNILINFQINTNHLFTIKFDFIKMTTTTKNASILENHLGQMNKLFGAQFTFKSKLLESIAITNESCNQQTKEPTCKLSYSEP